MKYLAGLGLWALLATLALGCTYNVEDSDMTGRLQKASGGGWSKSGTLLVGVPGTKQSMQADFPNSDNYTVQFGINTDKVPATFVHAIEAEALITWSVAGNDLTRRVSIGNGVSVMGTGQAVKVVMMDATQLGGGPVPGFEYDVSVQVAPGTRGNVLQPPVLNPSPSFFAAVPPGGIINVPIPQDAGVISVYVSVMSVAGIPIPENNVIVSHNKGPLTTFRVYDPRTFEWVPVAAGTTSIIIVNSFPSLPGIDIAVAFGIDG
jgi:hypothetical protein